MDFERRLRNYLEALPQPPGSPPVPLRRIDHDALYRHLLERLRELEDSRGSDRIERLHRKWTPEQIRLLAGHLETVQSPISPSDRAGAQLFAKCALDAAIGCPGPGLTRVDHLELARIIEGFGSDTVQLYANETRLVRRDPSHGTQLTNVGRTLLGLRGRDAIRWLLTVEVTQSTGRWDPWRAPRLLLQQAVHGGIERLDVDGATYDEFAPQTCERLIDLYVLSSTARVSYSDARRYEVADGMHDVVHAVLDIGPWHAAVAALLDDETAAALQSRAPSTVAASGQLTKLITHEVRNALIPVRHHIDALRAVGTDDAMLQRIDKARRGVVRVLEFVDDLVATTDLLSEPHTSCEVSDVIREAIRWADGEDRVEVAAGPSARVPAPRSRLVRAIHNVILNAMQATSPDGTVRASFRVEQGLVEIAIDDAGPGIPPELRERVFDEGYTTRGGPGHGFGLAFVRGVVEGALQGKLWCEASPLGGARFMLTIAEAKKP